VNIKTSCLCLVGAACLAAACASAPVVAGAESEAERLYLVGMAYLEDGSFEDAQEQFLKVISDFSYSKWEPFARIGLADSHFKREEFSAAREIYKLFLQMRPGHELADWAAFQLGNCFFEERPSDFWLLPPSEEKDLSDSVEKAVEHYRLYVRDHPQGKHIEEAKKNLAQAETMLVSRELSVAEFYLKKERCPAVKMRVAYIRGQFEKLFDDGPSPELQERLNALIARCPMDD